MATRTFSSRADERQLSFAEALSRREYGMSYGQYCGTVLLSSIEATGTLPHATKAPEDERKQAAASLIKGFSARARNPEVARLSDEDIRELIAGRYD